MVRGEDARDSYCTPRGEGDRNKKQSTLHSIEEDIARNQGAEGVRTKEERQND